MSAGAGQAGTRTVLLVAGEASGDMHGAELVSELRRLDPRVEVHGIGGRALRDAGMHVLVDTAEVATMGLVETFGTLGRLLSAYRLLRRFLAERKPHLLILIDYPEFNLLLAKRAKALGVPVFYYIGPQVWAWRRGRVRKIAARVDRLGLVFPFEPPLYNETPVARDHSAPPAGGMARPLAEFVGHPLLDLVRATRGRDETRARYGLAADKPLLAVLPGSRKKELRHLLPAALAAAEQLRSQGWQAVLALAHTLSPADLAAALDGVSPSLPIVEHDTYNVVHAADAALVASGTATLETALLGRPMVIMYAVSPLTYAAARLLVRVDHIGMPNIILGRRVFPELIQGDVTPANLVSAVHDVVARGADVQAALSELRASLGEPGAARRAAQLALEVMR